MASMRELFPLHNPKRNQRNFIRENIRNAKGCAQCIAERRVAENETSSKSKKASIPSKRHAQGNSKMPTTYSYNMKIVKRERSTSRSKHSNSADRNRISLSTRACQTEMTPENANVLFTSCENCGHSLTNLNGFSTSYCAPENGNDIKTAQFSEEKCVNPLQPPMKDSHQISHQNEVEKKETSLQKLQNPPSYKKGEIPKYLKERNAQQELDRQERETREKLEELFGFKDPKCPTGHMLMPSDELQRNLEEMETKVNSLITELNRMPVSNDSYRIRKRSIQIEKELKELEEKIDLYKTKKVFIKIPDIK